MKLNPKYFNLFIFIVALVSLIWIGYGTMTYKETQLERYRNYIDAYDSLTTVPLPLLLEDDSVSVKDFEGRYVVIQFWAGWSDKSKLMLQDIETSALRDSVVLIKALVKDDKEALNAFEKDSSLFVMGTDYYNRIRTPGMPGYLLFNRESQLISLGVGYTKGAIQDTLTAYINGN